MNTNDSHPARDYYLARLAYHRPTPTTPADTQPAAPQDTGSPQGDKGDVITLSLYLSRRTEWLSELKRLRDGKWGLQSGDKTQTDKLGIEQEYTRAVTAIQVAHAELLSRLPLDDRPDRHIFEDRALGTPSHLLRPERYVYQYETELSRGRSL